MRPVVVAALICALSVPVLSATPAAADPLTLDGPDWSVTDVPGGYEVVKQLDEPLEVRSDLPTLWADGVDLGAATESLDGLTLTVTTADPAAANPDDVLQGWAGVGDPAAEPVQRQQQIVESAAPSVPSPSLAADPSDRGEYAIERHDYDLGDEAVELRGFDRRGEIRASVFTPIGIEGERPVALFLHGRHTACAGGTRNPEAWPCNPDQVDIPSHKGYDDAAEVLASQGYAVVSISANAINSLDGSLADDTGAAARGQLVLDHLQLLRDANAGAAPDGVDPALKGRLDLDNVGLMGHSRGGEGIMRAAVLNFELDDPFGIRGLLPLAPTDYTRITVPGIPTATILPYCDGDVEDQMGQKYIDDSRHAFGDDVLRSSVLVMGTNHNFFNTYWTPGKYDVATSDDWAIMDRSQTDPVCGESAPTRLDADAQYAFGTAYIAGFFRLTLGEDEQFLPMFDGSDAVPSSAGDSDVRVSATLPSSRRFDIDNFASPGTPVQLAGAGDFAICESLKPLQVPGTLPYCVNDLGFAQAPDWSTLGWNGKAGSVPSTPAMHFTYEAPDSDEEAAGELRVPVPGGTVDATAYAQLSFRVSPDENVTDATSLDVTLVDGSGGQATVSASEFGDALTVLPGTENPLRKVLLQQITIPLAEYDGVELADVRQVRLTAPREDGGVLLSDLSFIGEPTLGTVEVSSRPAVSVPDVKVEEGAGVGSVDVPIVLSRPATTPATVYLTVLGSPAGQVGAVMQKVDFAEGEVCASVTVPMQGDRSASASTTASYVTNVSNTQRGATIGDSFGAIVLREDDGVQDDDGQPVDPIPAVGSQGDACVEALAEPGALSVSPASAAPGEKVTITGDGFRAGESVSLELRSDPVPMGSVTTDDGDVSFEATLPTDAEVGDHTFVATGYGSGYAQTAAFNIADPSAPTDPTDPGEPTDPTDPGEPTDPTDPGEPTDPGDSGDADTSSDGDSGSDPDDTGVGAPAADGPDDLAVTGADVAGWAAAGALLILGGLVALSRRRASAKGITGQQV
ncbi:hypothetical protein [Microbacterium sp. JB110]|nr:hypothetical protein [Microbacterium sp. JB110]